MNDKIEHEYAFDVRLTSVIRVKAKDEDEARAMVNAIQDEQVNHTCHNGAKITELSVDDEGHVPFEIDGVNMDEENEP